MKESLARIRLARLVQVKFPIFWRRMQAETPLTKNPDQASYRTLRARKAKDRWSRNLFYVLAAFPLILVAVIILVLFFRSIPILRSSPVWDLIAGRTWLPSEGKFGFLPFIVGTFWVTIVAAILAVPPCLLAAIYLTEYARPALRSFMKPLIDLLAAIPSVVYGVWGVVAIVPVVQVINHSVGPVLGLIPIFNSSNPTGYSILAGSIVLAVMIAPFIIAVTYEVLAAVPFGSREASLAIGATRWQTLKFAVFPQARPGIIAGVVLGASRALGETMAVIMVVGNVVQVPHSIFDAAYPLPALIANNYGEMLTIPLYDAALLTAALILLVIVLIFNVLSTLALRHIIGRSWS
jgi:phosphate transport system permease protein